MDYKTKKLKNQVLLKLFNKHLSEKALERIKNCCNFLVFAGDKTLEKKKVILTSHCENRFCPLCATKKSRKEAYKIAILLKYLDSKYRFLFLTLTAPNVLANDLNDEIKDFNSSFDRLIKRAEIKKTVKGYIRKLEVTYNKSEKSYHPHFHVLLAVNKSYFDSKNYISQKKWIGYWQESKRDFSITQVDIRKLDMKGTLEISKYVGKDSDYLYNQKVFDTMYKVLKGKKLITYNGVLKEAQKLYESGELDEFKEIDTTEYLFRLIYEWCGNDYLIKETRNLTEEEKAKINNLIDEMEVG